MASRLGKRVIHFANLPIKLLMPSPPFESISEIALKTIPSASKIEIKRVLESLYGFQVDEVRTLNMEGKKKKRGGFLASKPDYKKAYVTLRAPLSLSPDIFPVRLIQEERERTMQSSKSSVVEEGAPAKSHWLDGGDRGGVRGSGYRQKPKKWEDRRDGRRDFGRRSSGRGGRPEKTEESKFPWSSMRSWR